MTSWDDVTKLDLKICELLERYELKGTFFAVNDWLGKEISKEELNHISECHEIGAHTLNHVTLTHIGEEEAKKQIYESKKRLEKIIDSPVTSFAYPKGIYDKNHVKMVKDANYLCARTTKPFFTKKAENFYEMNVTLWAYPHAFLDIKGIYRLLKLSNKFIFRSSLIKDWCELGKQIFNILMESGGVFHIMGHAWQVDEINGWQRLEDLLEYIAFRQNVIYLTISDYARMSENM